MSCARHCFSYLDYIRDKNRPRPSTYKAYLLVGRDRQETTNLVKEGNYVLCEKVIIDVGGKENVAEYTGYEGPR